MKIELKELTKEDDIEIYDMLQTIPSHENGYTNDVCKMTFDEYKNWLVKSYESSLEKGLINGYKVPQTTYWLYVNSLPAGKGDIRHFLTDALKNNGGNIGLTIAPLYRGKGISKVFLKLLLEKAKELNVDGMLATIELKNTASYKMALSCGFELVKKSDTHYYVENTVYKEKNNLSHLL